MPIVASDKGGGDFKPVPAGTHAARCVGVYDLGVQPGGKFSAKHKVYLRWEIPSEIVEWKDADGNMVKGPMMIGKLYTLSLSMKANLRADLEAWRGKAFTEEELKGFDVVKVLGAPCMLGVTHVKGADNKVRGNIAAVMGLVKGMTVPPAHNKPVQYSPDEHNDAVWATLPNWLQDMVNARVINDKSPTVEGGREPGSDDDFNDDIPF